MRARAALTFRFSGAEPEAMPGRADLEGTPQNTAQASPNQGFRSANCCPRVHLAFLGLAVGIGQEGPLGTWRGVEWGSAVGVVGP